MKSQIQSQSQKSLNKPYTIYNLKFKDSFEQLSEEEKCYAYYLTKACWASRPIVLFQTSYEAPGLFIIFQTFFCSFPSFGEIKKTLLKNDITDINYKKFMHYASEFYSCYGNFYNSKKKFIPQLSDKEFEDILKISPKFDKISAIWELIKYIIYDNSPNMCTINLEENNGKNCYYFGGIKAEQIKKVDEKLCQKEISLLNTRIFMLNSNKVLVLIGSIEEKQEALDDEIILLKGEFSSFLKEVNENLEKAKKYVNNDLEKEILEDYINFFKTGNIENHKESQRKWVKDNLPLIDFNMGWLEPFTDPMGKRGYFESWVGISDKEKTQKYIQLINMFPQLITELPWDENFEIEEHNSVDFSAFDVLYYGKSFCPLGKCFPKYQDIRNDYGVKISALINALPNFNFQQNENEYLFCETKDIEIINNFGKQAVSIVSACKELLGHCTGKLFKIISDNGQEQKFNFNPDLINPLTGKVIDTFYKKNETFEERFGEISSLLEECRSQLIGLYFGSKFCIQELFHINECDNKEVSYTIWLIYFRIGIIGLNFYDEDKKEWQSPIIQAAFIFTTYILKNQTEGEEIIKVEVIEKEKEKTVEFHINVNREMILCSGNEILAKLLTKLHIWKCLGDVDSTKNFIKEYSIVDEKFLKIKKLIDKNIIPKKFFLYNNLFQSDDGSIIYKEYPDDLEGFIESNIDRYKMDYNDYVYNQWVKYATNFIKV